MKKVWEFFDNLNEYVYVSDMDNYELIYMNQKTLNDFGFSSNEEIRGKKCYEVLHKCSSPCSICNNHLLEPGSFQEWSHYNPVLDKYFSLKDSIVMEDGRRCRMELAIDVSTQERQNSMIRNYQNIEAIANEGLRIALQASTPDKTIEIIMEYLGKALGGERTYIFEQNESGGDDNTYEWVANGVTPEKENLQNLPPEVCANWYQHFSVNKNIMIRDLEDIRESDPLQYENLKRQSIHSLVVVPLFLDGKIIGFYGVDNPPKDFLDYAQNMLQIMGHFITGSLKRRNLVKQLQDLSYHDQLTRLGNRHALDEYISGICREESIGVAYCDITGLKKLNDTKGHEAGDRMIVSACNCLLRVFQGFGLFRVGGDELLVLCPGIREEDFGNKIKDLHEDMKEHDVTMAVGAAWKENMTMGFDSILSESEKLMYHEKAVYYRSGEMDRRSR